MTRTDKRIAISPKVGPPLNVQLFRKTVHESWLSFGELISLKGPCTKACGAFPGRIAASLAARGGALASTDYIDFNLREGI
jgi:hypothetical protein